MQATVKAGKLVCFSRGEYSDYGYCGHFLALEDLTPEIVADVIEACKAKARADDDNDGSEYGADGYFLPEMVRRGLILDVECFEVHYGSYGELEVS